MRCLLICLVFLFPLAVQADEWWAWSTLDVWQAPPWSASIFLGNRLDFDDGAYVQIVSPRFKYNAQPWLDLGVNLSALEMARASTGDRYFQFRPELELNPKFTIAPHTKLEWRNRLEFRLNEGESFTEHRTRHRLQLTWTLPQPWGALTRSFVSDEPFVDLLQGDLSENRSLPPGLTFRTSAISDLDVFYMILSHHHSGDWQAESVLGTYLHIRF